MKAKYTCLKTKPTKITEVHNKIPKFKLNLKKKSIYKNKS